MIGVVDVPEIQRVPLTRDWFLGMANIRGALYGVTDFGAFLGQPPTARGPDNRLLLIDAMRRGLGVGLVPSVMVREALRDGSLKSVLVDFRTEPRQLFAVYPSREHLPARVRALVDFLKDRLPRAGV